MPFGSPKRQPGTPSPRVLSRAEDANLKSHLRSSLRGSSSLINHSLIITANPHRPMAAKKKPHMYLQFLCTSPISPPAGPRQECLTQQALCFLPDFQCNVKAFQSLLSFNAKQFFHTIPDYSLFICKCFLHQLSHHSRCISPPRAWLNSQLRVYHP